MQELIYQIEKTLSDQAKALVIKLIPAKKQDYAFLFPSSSTLTKGQILKLAKASDREALDFLFEEEAVYQKEALKKKEKQPFSDDTVHISHRKTIKALKLLAATGRLCFNQRVLACDFFGKVDFVYFASADSLSGRLKVDGQPDLDIQQCDFLCGGPPHWYIKGIMLRLIATDISWKKLKEAQEGLLKREDLPLFLEEQQEENSPQVVLEKDFHTDIPPAAPSPLPILRLKDRHGGFADLWMDYGQGRQVLFQDTITKIFLRNFEQEKSWEKDLLETDFHYKMLHNSHYYCPLDKVAKSLSFLLEIGWQIYDWENSQILHHTQMDFQVDAVQQQISLRGKVRYDTHEVNLSDVAGAFNRRDKFVQLAPGTIGLIPTSWNQNHFDLFEECQIVGDSMNLKSSQFGSLSQFLEMHRAEVTTESSFENLKSKLVGFEGLQKYSLGSNFRGSLRPYQQDGLNWLSGLYELGLHGMLADDMGLGKTVQILAFLSRLKWSRPVLIILPTSLIFNWKKEIEQFLPHIPIAVYHGASRKLCSGFAAWEGIILTSYSTLRMDIEHFLHTEYECIILDEAQVIKNASTQTAKAIFQLKAIMRISLTGTPIENHPVELWSHFHFLIPELLGKEKDFIAEVSAGSSDGRYLSQIKTKIRPFLLRRKKEDVAKDLPEKIEQTVWVDLEPQQRRFYEEFLSGVKNHLLKKVELDGVGKHRMEVLESILRLRQICCHPLLVGSQMDSAEGAESAKLNALMEDLRTVLNENRKALIYSQFTSMLRILAKSLKQQNWNFVYLDGQTTNREQVVDQFQNDPNVPFFLISLKAGGVGLNLTAADYVFLYDPWWNDAAENQAIDRAHRIGRGNTIIAKRYVSIETIEEKIMKLKAAKKSLVESILSEDFNEVRLTEEDLLFLLT